MFKVVFGHQLCHRNNSSAGTPRSAVFRLFHCQQKAASHLRGAHLEFHLLSFLGVDGLDVLVVPQRVSAVLLLGGHVTLQSLQHPLRLGGERESLGWEKLQT